MADFYCNDTVRIQSWVIREKSQVVSGGLHVLLLPRMEHTEHALPSVIKTQQQVCFRPGKPIRNSVPKIILEAGHTDTYLHMCQHIPRL